MKKQQELANRRETSIINHAPNHVNDSITNLLCHQTPATVFFVTHMPIRLRLALHGTRHNRIFHLVAIDRGHRRDGKPTETLGIYNPHITKGHEQKTIEWSVDRIRYWLHVGALPSKSVVKLLEMVSLVYSSFPAPVLNVVYCLQGKILEPNSQYHPKATGPKSAKA